MRKIIGENKSWENKNCFLFSQDNIYVLLLFMIIMSGCGDRKVEELSPAVKTLQEAETKKGYVLENKIKENDGVHLSNDAKEYSDLEKQIDRLMDGIP